jgi:CRISPR type I-E-associated protein CasB/Cse2
MTAEPACQTPTAAILSWWGWLQLDIGESRAAAARLRRCTSVFDALLLSETHQLIKVVRRSGERRLAYDADQRLAVLAIALAHIKNTSAIPFAAALGRTIDGRPPNTKVGERPRLSPARFGALLRTADARNWDGFARALRRSVAILGDTTFYVPGLIGDVLHMGDKTLQHWTYRYWQTNAPGEFDSPSTPPTNNSNGVVQ